MLVASVFGVEGDDVVLPVDVHPVELTLAADLELVTFPGRDLESVGADLEGVDGVLEVGLARLLLQRVPLNRRGVDTSPSPLAPHDGGGGRDDRKGWGIAACLASLDASSTDTKETMCECWVKNIG